MLTEEERKARNKVASSKWRAANLEKNREGVRKWQKANPEKAKENCRKWRAANLEKNRERIRKWKKANPEKIKALVTKRRRELGFVPLNIYFKGSHAHHVDTEKVIYIPKFIHTQYRHDHNKPETMKEINKIAFNYLFGISQTVKFC